MAEVLLTSETFIKEVSNISDNVAGGYIQPSIRDAQEINLRAVLGDCLLDRLKELYDGGAFDGDPIPDEYIPYKALLDKIQYYLAYQAIVELLPRVSYKVANFGVSKSGDENLQVAGLDEIIAQEEYYQSKADAYCYQLQGWLLERAAAYPELDECACARIKSNLYSAATCGIWLGGPRGRKLPEGGGCGCK